MKRLSLNAGWYFAFENQLDCFNNFGFEKYSDAIGAPGRYYDFCNWQKVDLPHDWAVALDKDLRANTFAGARPNTKWHRFMTERHAALETVYSVGWYRKPFWPEEAWRGKRVFLEFEGVFRDAAVWVNGTYMDRHTSGYTSFWLEITDHLVFGEENSIAVRVDSEQNEGWWYEGAGIYRNVFLHVGEPVYVKPNQTIIKTQLDGTVQASCVLVNDTEMPYEHAVTFEIAGEGSVTENVFIAPYGEARVCTEIQISRPRLWHVEDPALYTLIIRTGEERHEETFGVRTVAFDAERGFLLNGQPVKIHGACVHQDFGGVGVALTDNLQYYKIRRLKEMGVNAYRCSHHAPAPALLRACDELGMLVMDETRLFGTSPEAVGQLTAVIERDRNHPCVFIWSLGNEEFSVQDEKRSFHLMKKMSRLAHALDDTRPVTYSGNNGASFDGANGAAEVRGVNYIRNDGGLGGTWLDQYHADHPQQPVIGTEESSYVLSRGGTADFGSGKLDAFGLTTMMWGSTPKGWVKFFEERDYLAGSFMWTGFDYRGEPNPYVTTNVSSSFGTIDLCGMEKPPFHYYRAWWTDEPVLQLAPHWNHRTGEMVEICAFTNCEEITLYLNGQLLETRRVNRFDAPLFRIPFEPGVLMAEGSRRGETLRCELHTSQTAATVACRCVLKAGTAEDTAIYELAAYDANGRFCPTAMNRVWVTAENGQIVGVGNGDPACLDPEQFWPEEEAVYLRTFRLDEDELYSMPMKEPNRLRSRHDWLETEPAGNGFEDDERRVARFADHLLPEKTVTLTTVVRDVEKYEYIEFERLGGKASVFLNGVEIGNNFRRSGRISISQVRPYRFYCRFREGENDIRIVSVCQETSAKPVSGTVKIGRQKEKQPFVRLHYGLARVFVRPNRSGEVRLKTTME